MKNPGTQPGFFISLFRFYNTVNRANLGAIPTIVTQFRDNIRMFFRKGGKRRLIQGISYAAILQRAGGALV
jgi:hypothetical protein